MRKPLYEGDLIEAQAEDLVWRFDDALRRGDTGAAESYRTQLAEFVVQHERSDKYFIGGTHRWWVVRRALELHLTEMALSELSDWRRTVILEDLEENNSRRTSARLLVSCVIYFLEDAPNRAHPKAFAVWAMLQELMPKVESVATADHTTAYVRLKRVMAGGNTEEQSLIAELMRLQERDAVRPSTDGLPPMTLFRLEALARHSLAGPESGIDTGLIWDACLKPFLPLAIKSLNDLSEKLSEVVAVPGGYAAVGGAKCLQELGDSSLMDIPAFLEILDVSLEFRRSIGVPPIHLSPREWDRWLTTHGPGTWLPTESR